MRETGSHSVWLDMRSIHPARFPNVVGALREAGLDPTCELVPVAPAAHYTIGGVLTDLRGRSTVPGLYALGETSCTGLHGANRLASNSLSECFVFGRRAALSALEEPPGGMGLAAPGRAELTPPLPAVEPATRGALWRHAGIERSAAGLRELLGDRHPLARLIASCALLREESRGVHHRTDFPQRDPALDHRHLVVEPGEAIAWEEWAPGPAVPSGS
jgi:L-aspartate oxidase